MVCLAMSETGCGCDTEAGAVRAREAFPAPPLLGRLAVPDAVAALVFLLMGMLAKV
jgi:hypothetical protein